MSLADYHEQFAAVYDRFYEARDVSGDVSLATELLGLWGREGRGAHVLDFGCGTGSHALAFAEQGLSVTGFDVSGAMISRAIKKQNRSHSGSLRFETGAFSDLCGQANGNRFDGVVSFFNVLNCIDSPGAMAETLRQIRSTIAIGARILIEVWNGAAVFCEQPQPSVRHFVTETQPAREVIRIMVPELERINQRCTLRYRVLELDRETGSFEEFESVHKLHYLTPVQYRHLFELADLTVVDEFPKGSPGEPITETDWYISYLLQRDS